MSYIKKYLGNKEKGSSTIEASLVFIIFIIGYLIINNISVNLMVESITRKALYETAIDVSSYIQIVDRLERSETIKTNKINYKEYSKLILKEFNENKEGDYIDDISYSLKELFKRDVIGKVKVNLYNNIIKKIFISKLKKIKNIQKLDSLGVINGIEGFNFKDTEIFEDSNKIKLSLNYKFKIDKFGFISTVNNIKQNLVIEVWVNNLNKNDFQTIWNESNFDRGRYFVNIVSNENKYILRKGKGFDYYTRENNTLVQVITINIFKGTYTELKGNKYMIKDGLIKKIKFEYKKMKKNFNDISGNIVSKEGKIIKLNNPNLKLKIVLPEETLEMTNYSEYMQNIKDKIGNIDFIFKEKALND